MKRLGVVVVALVLTGCSSYSTEYQSFGHQLYQECTRDLVKQPFWQNYFDQKPLPADWEQWAKRVDLEWKQMCLNGAYAGTIDNQVALDRMGQTLMLQNQNQILMNQMFGPPRPVPQY